jgi:RNA polymerase sigma-70 factor (ECF subfamily)
VESTDARDPDRVPSDAELARTIATVAPGGAPRVRRYGLRHLRDAQASADLAQQVLLVTLESLRAGRVREPEKLPSFVLGACRRFVQEQRRGDARRRHLLDRYAEDLPVARVDPSPAVDSDRLRECLERLAARARSVVVMSFYAQRSADEVAAELGLSPGNVRVIRHRALGRLRACLTGEEGRP